MDIQKADNRYHHISISQVDAFAEWEASDSEETVQPEPKVRSQLMPQYPSLDELEMDDGQGSCQNKKEKLFLGGSTK